jgi:hypothetical protein
MVENIKNMLFADVFYIRAELDQDYLSRYFEIQQEKQWASESSRLGMIVLGAVMMATAVIPGVGWATAIWGADLICSATTGKSMFDHVIHGAMSLAGVSEDTVNSFSFMHFTGDKTLDLICQELVAGGISSAAGSGAKKLARAGKTVMSKAGTVSNKLSTLTGRFSTLTKYTSSLATKFDTLVSKLSIKSIGSKLGKAGKWLSTKIDNLAKESIEQTAKTGLRQTGKMVIVIVGGAALESIMEFGFDALDSMNEGDRPAFGNKAAFFGVMIGMQLFSAGMAVKSTNMGKQARGIAAGLEALGIEGDEISRLVDLWVDSRFLAKYGRQVGYAMQGVMWMTVLPTLASFAGL